MWLLFTAYCLYQDDAGQQTMNRFSMRYDDVETPAITNRQSGSTMSGTTTRKNTTTALRLHNIPKPPPLVDPILFSTNPVPPSAFLMAAAASGELI